MSRDYLNIQDKNDMSLNSSPDPEKPNRFKVWKKKQFLGKKAHIEFMNSRFSKIAAAIANFLQKRNNGLFEKEDYFEFSVTFNTF